MCADQPGPIGYYEEMCIDETGHTDTDQFRIVKIIQLIVTVLRGHSPLINAGDTHVDGSSPEVFV